MNVVILQSNYTPMNNEEFNRARLDMVLEMFDKSPAGAIEKSVLFSVPPGGTLPPDYDKALRHLVTEGCLEENKHGFAITYKGRAIFHEGGFVGKYRREVRGSRLEHFGIITGIVCGVAGLILSIIALVK